MRLLVVSDTHGDDLILQELLVMYPNLAGYFYCGDSELSETNPLFKTYRAVVGNMDWDQNFPLTLTTTIEGTRIFMTHGHRFGVNFGLDDLVTAGQQAGAKLVFYGHTHVALAQQHQGMVVVNPGSISQPRGALRTTGGTYALIDVTPDAVTVQYGSRHGLLPELTQTFKR